MKTTLFMIAGFAAGYTIANFFYDGGNWWLWGGIVGAAIGWVFSGAGEKRGG